MQCYKCPSNPRLTKVDSELDRSERPHFSEEKINCFGCGTKIKVDVDDFYHCGTCSKYSLCDTCRFCNNGHALIKSTYLKNMNAGYSNDSFICNTCSANSKAQLGGIWHCTYCEYDACSKCLE